MASKIIQAEARITALDATGETFANIARKVRGLSTAFKSLGNVTAHGVGNVNRTIGRMNRSMQAFGPLATGTAGLMGVTGLESLARETVKATAQQFHERIRMELAGMAPEERAEAERLSLALSQRYKTFSQTEVLHSLRNMRAIVGTYEEAAKLLEPVIKLRTAVLSQHPERASELDQDFDQLMKSQEILGINQDPARFIKDMGMIAKAMAVFGDTLKPTDFFAFAQHARLAGQGFGDDFLFSVAPTLMQHMGGAQAGTALSALFQAFAGGHMTVPALRELMKLGLVDRSHVNFSKAGLPTKMLPGALKENELFKDDPYQWIQKVLLPTLKARGISSKNDFENLTAVLASSRTAGQALAILSTQQQNIEKDRALIHGAPELNKQVEIASKDPFVAFRGMTEQLENLLAVVGSPLAEPAAKTLNEIAAGIVTLEKAAKGAPLSALALGVGGLGLGGLGVWKAARATMRGLGFARSATAASEAAPAGGGLMAPLFGTAAPIMFGGLGALDYLRGKEAQHQTGLPVDRDVIAQLPWWRRSAGWIQEHVFGADPNLLYPELRAKNGLTPSGAHAAEVKGSADLNVNVQVQPSDDFISRIVTAIKNEINAFGGSDSVGSAGSTGVSMPEAKPNP